jgi:thiosulfate dehydrogenase (quinone) large subunit
VTTEADRETKLILIVSIRVFRRRTYSAAWNLMLGFRRKWHFCRGGGIIGGVAPPTVVEQRVIDPIRPMHDSSRLPPTQFGPSSAYGLTRICLGLNILMHGLVRWPHLGNFAAALEKQFAGTFLSGGMVLIAAHAIVYGEAIIGLLVMIGFRLRIALVAGMCLMILLQMGTTLLADWNTAGTQLIYIALYAGLLAAIKYDALSIDVWRLRKAQSPRDEPLHGASN